MKGIFRRDTLRELVILPVELPYEFLSYMFTLASTLPRIFPWLKFKVEERSNVSIKPAHNRIRGQYNAEKVLSLLRRESVRIYLA